MITITGIRHLERFSSLKCTKDIPEIKRFGIFDKSVSNDNFDDAAKKCKAEGVKILGLNINDFKTVHGQENFGSWILFG